MIVTLIAAVDNKLGIGLNNDMPWGRIKEDLQFFKSMTNNSTVIMGRYTFESIKSVPLPNRCNIIITRNKEIKESENNGATSLIYKNSLEDALFFALKEKNHEIFIIGGAQIYQQSICYADKLYLTHIPENYSCDRFFPCVDEKDFLKTKVHSFIFDDRPVQVFKYERIKHYSFV